MKQWSQEKMADKMNMSLSGYAKIERGETKLYYEKLVQISNIFHIRLEELICVAEDISESDHQVNLSDIGACNPFFTDVLEVEKLKLLLSHKEELLIQKDKELEHLRKIITLLER
ncbi:Helix-turn-helix domain [Actinobacillus equuli]|nr:Helix-turn-helix domain [Actinobacillus equuli]